MANSSKFGTNPLPGLTCFSEAYISLAFLPGSCAHIALNTPLIFLVMLYLSEELVAGEAYNLERLVRVPLGECIERVVLRRDNGLVGW